MSRADRKAEAAAERRAAVRAARRTARAALCRIARDALDEAHGDQAWAEPADGGDRP